MPDSGNNITGECGYYPRLTAYKASKFAALPASRAIRTHFTRLDSVRARLRSEEECEQYCKQSGRHDGGGHLACRLHSLGLWWRPGLGEFREGRFRQVPRLNAADSGRFQNRPVQKFPLCHDARRRARSR